MPGWQIRERLGAEEGSTFWSIERQKDHREAMLRVIRIAPAETMPGGPDEQESRLSAELLQMRELAAVPEAAVAEDSALLREPEGLAVLLRMEPMETLEQYLRRRGEETLGQEEAIRMGRQVCAVLQALERRGLPLQEVRDSDIFVDAQGHFRLMVPGAAWPQEDGAQRDAAMYSLGLLLYRQFNHGRPPFVPAWPVAVSEEQLREAVRRCESGEEVPVPDGADELTTLVIRTALDADPGRRWNSFAAFGTALREVAAVGQKKSGTARESSESAPSSAEGDFSSSVAGSSSADDTSSSSLSGAERHRTGAQRPHRSRRGILLTAAAVLLVTVLIVAVILPGVGGRKRATGTQQTPQRAETSQDDSGERVTLARHWMTQDRTAACAVVRNSSGSLQLAHLQFRWLDASDRELRRKMYAIYVPAGESVPFQDTEESGAESVKISVRTAQPFAGDLFLGELRVRIKSVSASRMTFVVENRSEQRSTEDLLLRVLNHTAGETDYAQLPLPVIDAGKSTEVSYDSGTGSIDREKVFYGIGGYAEP